MSKRAFSDRVRAAAATLAHKERYAFVAAGAVEIATLPGPLPGFLDALGGLVVGVWISTLLAWFVHDHDTSLCIPCIETVPADAPIRAERRKFVLWFQHFLTRRVALVITLMLVFGPSILLIALHLELTDVARWAYVPMTAWFFAGMFAVSQHRQLRPWCSYCRGWDKDGDHEPSPDPVAFDAKTPH